MNSIETDPHIRRLANQFDLIADSYDELWTARIYDVVLLESLPTNSTNVLEVGCGSGHFLRTLSLRGVNAVGIDISKRMVQLAKMRTKECNCEILRLAAEDAANEFSKHSFDAVIAERTLHHCEYVRDVVVDLASLLKPGGRFIVLELESNESHESFTLSKLKQLLYWAFVIRRGIYHRAMRTAVRGLLNERALFRTTAWKNHASQEPAFTWELIAQAMSDAGLIVTTSRLNSRFHLIIGVDETMRCSSR